MPNMSYCRFENTIINMRECLNAIRDGDATDEVLSNSELEARNSMFAMCEALMDELSDLDEYGVK